MSYENTYIQTFINKCDSLSDITNVISLNRIKDYRIPHTVKCKESSFVLSRTTGEDINNTEILCSKYYNNEGVSKAQMMRYICEKSKKELDGVSCIKIFISDDTRHLSEENRRYLAKCYSSFSQFLLEKFEKATEISIINGFGSEKINDSFVFQIIETLKTNSIQSLTGLDINDIICFGKKCNFMESDIFNEMNELKKVTLSFDTTTDNIDHETVMYFLNYLKMKNISLNVSTNFMENCSNIVEYCEKVRINFKIDLQSKSFKLSGIERKAADKLSSIQFYLETFNDFVDLEEAINSLANLETIKINVGRFVQKIVSEESFDYIYSSYYLSQFTHFKCISKKLSCVEISSVYGYPYDDTKMEEVQLFCNYLLEQLISILPETITSLSLLDTNGIEGRTFKKISYELPLLTTILFVRCNDIPEESLIEFRELKNVVFYGDSENILDTLDSQITIKGINRN
uniref:F-box domain-containing protein n=1 Tax=Strongyloides papillosus TaxID=174720 RepID=A0A0N5C412_STREA